MTRQPAESGAGRSSAHDMAARMLAFSQARVAAFAPFDLAINDTMWDLLLGLFVAQERGDRLSLYGLCDTLDLPKTVTIRWLRALDASGLVEYEHERDGLTAPVRLTPAADQALRALIDA